MGKVAHVPFTCGWVLIGDTVEVTVVFERWLTVGQSWMSSSFFRKAS